MTTQRPADARTELRRGPETQHEAEMWGSAPWERIEHLPAPTHARILLVLSVGPSVRSLDLGTATGAVLRCSLPSPAHI
jgi:hypothetical protein